jgi:predicted nucleotidyltransferase
MHSAIYQHRSGIATICQRYCISRLEVFGSAARAIDFNPTTSDVDFLVEFAPDSQPGAVRNPYVLASMNRSRESVYAA